MKVLNKHHLKTLGPADVYVGRGSELGNPYRMDVFREDRGLVVNLHRRDFLNNLANMKSQTKALFSIPMESNLVCYCHPLACHADVYKEFREKTVGMTYKEARKYFLALNSFKFLPELEGITHINIYSRSSTQLGRLTSNFTHSPFEHPDHGWFESMEGYWFWLSSGMAHEEFRELHGLEAKSKGGGLKKVFNPDFDWFIERGCQAKVDHNPELKKLLSENHLPFRHYYFYGQPDNCSCVLEDGLLNRIYTKISQNLGESFDVLITGAESVKNPDLITKKVLESGIRIKTIYELGGKGVDAFINYYAKRNYIPVVTTTIEELPKEVTKAIVFQDESPEFQTLLEKLKKIMLIL